jgi:hypothetical protein
MGIGGAFEVISPTGGSSDAVKAEQGYAPQEPYWDGISASRSLLTFSILA